MKTSKNDRSIKVPVSNLSRHDLSHQHLTTIDFFRLQPIECFECVAGDKISLNVRSLIEAAPFATKVYGAMKLDLHAFFVPFRLLWSSWNDYYYQNNSISSFPTVDVGSPAWANRMYPSSDSSFFKNIRSAMGGLGYPVYSSWSRERSFSQPLSALPLRAYNQVWWDWFRDSVNIDEGNKSAYLNTTSGPMTDSQIGAISCRYRTFQKDPITTLLSAKASAVGGSTTDIIFNGATAGVNISASPTTKTANVTTSSLKNTAGGDLSVQFGTQYSSQLVHPILASLQVPILRGAVAMQRFLERHGISGSRTLERIMSTFGMRPSPERLDMSEFIGYKSVPIGVDGLINTGSSSKLSNSDSSFGNDSSSSFGTFGGRSSASGQSDTWSYNAVEHGYIMVIASVVPEYINGNVLPRYLTRGCSANTRGFIDFYQPDYDGSGYQDVILSSIAQPIAAASPSDSWNDLTSANTVVGYQPMYEDYRYEFDRIGGDFLEPGSYNYLRNMAFVRDLTRNNLPTQISAGLRLSTATDSDQSMFDNLFQVTNSLKDHFILNNYIVVDALRPISSSQLPTELSDLANSSFTEISKQGVRL